MIVREFLSELKAARGEFDWQFYGRHKRIRGLLKNGATRQVFDPLTAVCYSKTGRLFSEEDWTDASSEIELSWIDAGDLNAALNNVPGADDSYVKVLRQELINALMLDSEPEWQRTEVPADIPVLGSLFRTGVGNRSANAH